jgi:hypothetical protein
MSEVPPQGVPELRPLGIGELVDVSLKIWRRHFGALARVVLVVVAPIEILTALAIASADDPGVEAGAGDAVAGGAAFVGVALRLLATLVASAATLQVVTVAYLGGEPDWRQSLQLATRRLPALLWLTVLTGAGLVLGFIALVFPGIYLSVAWSLAFCALMAEDLKGTAALGRSYRLVRGRWWPTFGTLLLAWILMMVVGFFVQLPFGLAVVSVDSDSLGFFVVSAVSGVVSAVVTTPFLATIFILLYFDLRVRKEGFDLELLTQAVGLPALSTDAPDATADWRPSDPPPPWPPPSAPPPPPPPPPSGPPPGPGDVESS